MSTVYTETQATIDNGYSASYFCLSASAGRILTDETNQTVSATSSATLQIFSTRFDDPNTPLVSTNNLLLPNITKTWSVTASCNLSSVITHSSAVVRLDLHFFDGITDIIISGDTFNFHTDQTICSLSCASLVRSGADDSSFIYAVLTNNTDSDIVVDSYGITTIRMV
jgi:hypothetical protein